jgi:hypothetical protein
MLDKVTALVASVAVILLANGCGSTRLLSIQAVPLNPNLTSNNIVYIPPGGSVQYEIVGWYSDETSKTISNSLGHWSSSNGAIATVAGSGLATSVGPVGITTIVVTVSGHESLSYLSVCDPTVSFCPP